MGAPNVTVTEPPSKRNGSFPKSTEALQYPHETNALFLAGDLKSVSAALLVLVWKLNFSKGIECVWISAKQELRQDGKATSGPGLYHWLRL